MLYGEKKTSAKGHESVSNATTKVKAGDIRILLTLIAIKRVLS